jgi:hypothetical protein
VHCHVTLSTDGLASALATFDEKTASEKAKTEQATAERKAEKTRSAKMGAGSQEKATRGDSADTDKMMAALD